MWVRAELKQRAKQNLKRYYWPAVIVCCIFFIDFIEENRLITSCKCL